MRFMVKNPADDVPTVFELREFPDGGIGLVATRGGAATNASLSHSLVLRISPDGELDLCKNVDPNLGLKLGSTGKILLAVT